MGTIVNRTNVACANGSVTVVHIWGLNDRNVPYELKWRIKYRGPDFNPLTKKCKICLKEKHFIMYHRDGSTLNRRNEIFNTCRHRKRKLLENLKTWCSHWFLFLDFSITYGNHYVYHQFMLILPFLFVFLKSVAYSYMKEICRIFEFQ